MKRMRVRTTPWVYFSNTFCARFLQNVTRKKTFVWQTRAKNARENVGEIDPLSIFQQHFYYRFTCTYNTMTCIKILTFLTPFMATLFVSFQLPKNMLLGTNTLTLIMRKNASANFGEIERHLYSLHAPCSSAFALLANWRQFHQHFMRAFFCTKDHTKPNSKQRKALLYKKCAHKTLMKLTPGWWYWPLYLWTCLSE